MNEGQCTRCPSCGGAKFETKLIPGKKYSSKQECEDAAAKAQANAKSTPVQRNS